MLCHLSFILKEFWDFFSFAFNLNVWSSVSAGFVDNFSFNCNFLLHNCISLVSLWCASNGVSNDSTIWILCRKFPYIIIVFIKPRVRRRTIIKESTSPRKTNVEYVKLYWPDNKIQNLLLTLIKPTGKQLNNSINSFNPIL